MKKVTFGMLLLLLSMSAVGLLIARRKGQEASQSKPVVIEAAQDRLLAVGKKLFVERCAKCHDERGDKPLAGGPPLSERELSDTVLARAVSGRFRDKSDEEKRVVLYIWSFMKKN